MRRIVAVTLLASFVLGTPVSASGAPSKKYKNCTELRKDYPKGVAATKKSAKLSGAKLAPAIYKANKSKDRDKDGAACEV